MLTDCKIPGLDINILQFYIIYNNKTKMWNCKVPIHIYLCIGEDDKQSM